MQLLSGWNIDGLPSRLSLRLFSYLHYSPHFCALEDEPCDVAQQDRVNNENVHMSSTRRQKCQPYWNTLVDCSSALGFISKFISHSIHLKYCNQIFCQTVPV